MAWAGGSSGQSRSSSSWSATAVPRSTASASSGRAKPADGHRLARRCATSSAPSSRSSISTQPFRRVFAVANSMPGRARSKECPVGRAPRRRLVADAVSASRPSGSAACGPSRLRHHLPRSDNEAVRTTPRFSARDRDRMRRAAGRRRQWRPTSTRSPMMPAPRYSGSRAANHMARASTSSWVERHVAPGRHGDVPGVDQVVGGELVHVLGHVLVAV